MGLHVTMVDLLVVRNVEVMTAVNVEVANVFVHPFNACQPRFAVRQRFHTFRIGRVPVVIGKRDSASFRFDLSPALPPGKLFCLL